MFNEYGKLSTQLYELTKPIGTSLAGDIDYYAQKLEALDGVILEAGVGTGRMLIPLLEKGLKIEGVDLSSEMLRACQDQLDQRQLKTNLYLQDLTTLDLPLKYQGIIMPTGSFGLLPKPMMPAILDAFFQHLVPGGQLICDVELPVTFKPNEVSVTHHPFNSDQGILFTSTSQAIDWYAQKVAYIHRYELLTQGTIEETEVSHFVLHWYSPLELDLLLKAAGFDHVEIEIGYNQDSDSPLFTFIATKLED